MKRKLECPTMATIAMISDKWKIFIISQLKTGTMRFSEIQKSLDGITQKVLTNQLRELEADGLIFRRVYAEVPPRVEYSLTPLGETLIPILDNLQAWAKEHSSEILKNREKAEKAKEAESFRKKQKGEIN